jgi:hypothetical protein
MISALFVFSPLFLTNRTATAIKPTIMTKKTKQTATEIIPLAALSILSLLDDIIFPKAPGGGLHRHFREYIIH